MITYLFNLNFLIMHYSFDENNNEPALGTGLVTCTLVIASMFGSFWVMKCDGHFTSFVAGLLIP